MSLITTVAPPNSDRPYDGSGAYPMLGRAVKSGWRLGRYSCRSKSSVSGRPNVAESSSAAMETIGARVSPTSGRLADARRSPLTPRYRKEFAAAAMTTSRRLSPDERGRVLVSAMTGGGSGTRFNPRGFDIDQTVYSSFS